jgi:antitoxin ParD1/3/4
VVTLAAFVRVFAQKVTALPRPRALTCYDICTIIRYILVFLRWIMAKNTSMTLGEHFDGFIAHQIECGRYGSASEVVRAGLRVLEDKECKLDVLRQMLTDGEESGITDYSYDSLMTELDAESGI